MKRIQWWILAHTNMVQFRCALWWIQARRRGRMLLHPGWDK
jgi:hypothetical protein